jgi:hypothetical protein
MPRLACFACGRTIWATVPLASLFADERRCPRCGAALHDDRRQLERRLFVRRQRIEELAAASDGERRVGDRRLRQRRRATV